MKPVKYCTTTTVAKFIFENVVTRFDYPKILISDQGTHFVNNLIIEMTIEFKIQHKNMTPYHPQANGTIGAFNRILENPLIKLFNVHRDEWDQKVSKVLWDY